MAHVTVVNDSPEFLDLVGDILEGDRYGTTLVDGDRDDALELIRASQPDLLMIDLRLGSDELHGWDVAQAVRGDPDFAGLPVLVCSADVQALKAIAEDLDATHRVTMLTKPFEIDELTDAIDGLLAAPAR